MCMFLQHFANNKITVKAQTQLLYPNNVLQNFCSISFFSFHWYNVSHLCVWLISAATHFNYLGI